MEAGDGVHCGGVYFGIDDDMRALSIRQPWAWLILNSSKDVENRDWATSLRGRILVHAGKGMTREEYENAADLYWEIEHKQLPHFQMLDRGGIVGSVEILDCVSECGSKWFYGAYGFVLGGAKTLPFRPYLGRLGFFEVPEIS